MGICKAEARGVVAGNMAIRSGFGPDDQTTISDGRVIPGIEPPSANFSMRGRDGANAGI